MMTCSQCGLEQDEGKFCGVCGGELVKASESGQDEPSAKQEQPDVNATPQNETQQAQDEMAVAAQAHTAPTGNTGTHASTTANESMEAVMETSRMFGTYFTHYIKQPARIFSKGTYEVKNGFISIILVAVLLALSFYNFFKDGFEWMDISFLSAFLNILLFNLISIAIIISLLFLVNKFFGADHSFKDIVAFYGAHVLPVIILAGFTLLLAFAKSMTFGLLLLMAVFALITFILPLFLISTMLTKHSKSIDPFYGYLSYIVVAIISFIILSAILVDSMMGEIMSEISYYL